MPRLPLEEYPENHSYDPPRASSHLIFGLVSQSFTWSFCPDVLGRPRQASRMIDLDRLELLPVSPRELAASDFDNPIFGIPIKHLHWIDVA